VCTYNVRIKFSAFLRRRFATATVLVVVCSPLVLFADTCPDRSRTVTVSSLDSGVQVNGPICVHVQANVLRYASALSFQTSLAIPDLTKPFSGGGGGRVPNDLSGIIADFESNLQSARNSVQKNDAALVSMNGSLSAIRMLVGNSDTIFQSGGARGLLAEKNNGDFQKSLAEGAKTVTARFEVLDKAIEHLQLLQIKAQAISLSGLPQTDTDKTRLANLLDALKTEIAALTPYTAGGDKTATFIKQAQAFLIWKNRIDGLTSPDSFVVERWVPCNLFGNQTKAIAVSLKRIDLLPTIDNNAGTSADLTTATVTVNCPSPFSISGGMALSFIETQSFGLIPTATANSYTFGITHSTSVNPMPLAMVHARLYELPSHSVGFHVGFGVAVHAQDDAAGGTGAEYLLGAGVLLFRTIFLTPGLHYGRTTALSPGYKVGDAVPSAVTTAPTVNRYTPGFGLAITFTKP